MANCVRIYVCIIIGAIGVLLHGVPLASEKSEVEDGLDGFVALDDEGVDDDGDAMSADYSVHSYFEQSRHLMMFCPVFYKYKYPLDFTLLMMQWSPVSSLKRPEHIWIGWCV